MQLTKLIWLNFYLKLTFYLKLQALLQDPNQPIPNRLLLQHLLQPTKLLLQTSQRLELKSKKRKRKPRRKRKKIMVLKDHSLLICSSIIAEDPKSSKTSQVRKLDNPYSFSITIGSFFFLIFEFENLYLRFFKFLDATICEASKIIGQQWG